MLPLSAAGVPAGTLELPGTVTSADLARARERIAPSLGSILAAALHREELQDEVVETDALRRSDELKTGAAALRLPRPAHAGDRDPDGGRRARPVGAHGETVAEVRGEVLDAATSLWRLIEKLLDLSLLQAGRLEQGGAWCSLEEVLHEAVEQTRAGEVEFSMSIDRDLPPLQGDPAQLERAFVNVLENAARFSAGKPVSVRARAVGDRLRVRIVDQGPGIGAEERERVFLPFYRSHPPDDGGPAHHGSGSASRSHAASSRSTAGASPSSRRRARAPAS